jgi:hypothetical protein
VDNSALRFSYDERKSQTSRSQTDAYTLSTNYNFRSEVGNVSVPLIPGTDLRLRLTPTVISFNTGYANGQTDTKRFSEIIELPGDTAFKPVLAYDQRLLSNTNISFEPLTALTGRWLATEARNLVPTDLLVSGQAAQDAINAERTTFLGTDLGWETGRNITMNWTYRPNLATWLIPQAALDTRYGFSRGPSFITQLEGDTVLTSDFSNSRVVRLSAGFNAPAMLRQFVGQEATGMVGGMLALFDWIDIFTATWSGTLGSRYQRQPAHPSVSYQLGFGGFDSFRVQDGDTASQVADGDNLTLNTGVRLPFGAAFNVDYATEDQDVWTPINQTVSRGTTWPSVNFNWSRIPLPNIIDQWVSGFALRAGYTFRKTENDVVGGDQTRTNTTRTIPFSVNLALTTEWTFGYSLNSSRAERRDPTGLTLGNSLNQSLEVRGRIRPISAEGSLSNPVLISLRVAQETQDQCRQLGAAAAEGAPPGVEGSELPECEPFTDQKIRTIDLTVSTDIQPFSIGLQGSWRDTQSEIGQRPGSTQLEISLFGQFQFESGEIR